MKITRTTAAMATLATLAAGLSLTAAPAQAYGMAGGSLSAPDTVAYPGCRTNPIHWSVTVPAEADDFDFDVSVTDPTGREVGSDFVWTGGVAKTSGVSDAAFLCDDAVRGRYTVRVTDAEWEDSYNYDEHPFTIASTTFHVRSPHSRVRATHRSHHKHVKIRVKVRDERRTGYFPTRYADVKLQKRHRGHWHTIRRGMTNRYGRETFSFKKRHRGHRHRMTLRVYVPRDGYTASATRRFHIRR